MAGRTIAAHNTTFDLRFLAHEMVRSGLPLKPLLVTGLCITARSSVYPNAPSRCLVDCAPRRRLPRPGT